ncbi:cytochrome P450 [Diaporthe sp. PMI_573]|nr:cytochrome P450 [Diaporthaceae sp. PMI_573]
MHGTTFESPGLFTDSRLNTIDPVNIQAILATQFQDFELGQQLNRRLLLGKCIFTTDGPFWEHSRAIFKPQFAREQINNLQETEVAVQELFRALSLVGTENASDSSVEADIMPMFYRFTMDTATKFPFGESVEAQMSAASGGCGKMTSAAVSLTTEFGPGLNFADALSKAQLWITQRIRLQGLHWFIPSKRGRMANAFVRKYAAHCVQIALQSASETKTLTIPSPSGAYSLLDTLVESTRDPDELRDQILGLLLAGRDTTASLFILDGIAPGTPPGGMLKSCRYLQFTLREALRLYDPSPANVRFAARDTTLPRWRRPGRQRADFCSQRQDCQLCPASAPQT